MEKSSNGEKVWVKLNELKFGEIKFTIPIFESEDNNLDNMLFVNLIFVFNGLMI